MFRKTVALLLCLSIIGCSSAPPTTIISNEAQKNEQFKGEIVGEFLITEDGNKLVIIGNKHHFIFPLNKNLREILLWQGRKNLSASLTTLTRQQKVLSPLIL